MGTKGDADSAENTKHEDESTFQPRAGRAGCWFDMEAPTEGSGTESEGGAVGTITLFAN